MSENSVVPDDLQIRGDESQVSDRDVAELAAIAQPLPQDERLVALLIRARDRVDVITQGMGFGTTIHAQKIDDVWKEVERSNWLN